MNDVMVLYDESTKQIRSVSYNTIATAFHVIDARIQEQENLGRHIFKDAQELESLAYLRMVFKE